MTIRESVSGILRLLRMNIFETMPITTLLEKLKDGLEFG